MKQKKCKVTLNSRHDKMSGTTSHLCYYKTEKKKKRNTVFIHWKTSDRQCVKSTH